MRNPQGALTAELPLPSAAPWSGPGFDEGLAWFRAARGGRGVQPGDWMQEGRLGCGGEGEPSTVRGPRLHPLRPLPHAHVGAPSVFAEIRAGVDTGQGRSTEEAGVFVSGQLQKEEAGRFPKGRTSRGCSSRRQGCVMSQDEAGWPPRRHLPRARHPPSVTPMMRAPPHCVHTPPAPGTSGHVWGGSWRCWRQAGSQPQGRPPPSSAREEGPSAQSQGSWGLCLGRRS